MMSAKKFLSFVALAVAFAPHTAWSSREAQNLPGKPGSGGAPQLSEPLQGSGLSPVISSHLGEKHKPEAAPPPPVQPKPAKTVKKKASPKRAAVTQAATTQKKLPPPPKRGTPITLKDTIYGVLRHHRELRSLQEDREVMKHELKRAQAGFGPSIDMQGNAGTAIISDSSTRRHDLDNTFLGVVEASARLTQPIWDGFATRSRVRSAQSTLDSVKARIFDTATTLSLDGIIAQIDLNRRRVIYQLSQKNVDTHRSILAQTQERSEMGADTQADVTQAQSRLARALSSLSEAQGALIVAEETYTRLTGLPPAANIQEVPLPPVTFSGPKQVMDLAEKNNPKIASYLQDIRALQADKQLAQSTYYPTFNVEVGPSYSNRNRFDDRWTYSFDVVGSMRWNLFNSGADYQEVKAAGARIRESRQTLYNFLDTLKLDIQSTWINYLAAKDQQKFYSEAVEYNEFTREAYLEQFQMGERTLLDVLDAENELYNSSTQAETARGNILVGAWRLCALSGDLLPMLNIDLAPVDMNPERDPKDPREEFDMGWFK